MFFFAFGLLPAPGTLYLHRMPLLDVPVLVLVSHCLMKITSHCLMSLSWSCAKPMLMMMMMADDGDDDDDVPQC